MHALTLWQPWATAITHGPKRIENRPWKTPQIVGKHFFIHAGKKYDKEGAEKIRALWPEMPDDVPQGAIVGVARVIGVIEFYPGLESEGPRQSDLFKKASLRDGYVAACMYRQETFSKCQLFVDRINFAGDPWFFGPYGWILDDVHTLTEPIPCKGFQKLWTPPEHVVKKCFEQLETVSLSA